MTITPEMVELAARETGWERMAEALRRMLADQGGAPPSEPSAAADRPEPIRVDFLVYGECRCGWWCAVKEGGSWPFCPRCDKRVFPHRDEERDGNGVSSAHGYVAELYDELTAVQLAHERGYDDCAHVPDGGKAPVRLYAPDDPLLNPKR